MHLSNMSIPIRRCSRTAPRRRRAARELRQTKTPQTQHELLVKFDRLHKAQATRLYALQKQQISKGTRALQSLAFQKARFRREVLAMEEYVSGHAPPVSSGLGQQHVQPGAHSTTGARDGLRPDGTFGSAMMYDRLGSGPYAGDSASLGKFEGIREKLEQDGHTHLANQTTQAGRAALAQAKTAVAEQQLARGSLWGDDVSGVELLSKAVAAEERAMESGGRVWWMEKADLLGSDGRMLEVAENLEKAHAAKVGMDLGK